MITRRRVLKFGASLVAIKGLMFGPVSFLLDKAMAQSEKTVVPRGTSFTDLRNRNPKELDTSNLEITPLKDFGTMGLEDHEVNPDEWRLIVDGEVEKELKLSYPEVQAAPAVERAVLMICPGFFANNGMWKGISMKALLESARLRPGVTHVSFRGPEGKYEKVLQVPIEDAMTNMVFLAYQVNGEPLPRKHGFPLRVVAEGYYGSDWVKYVYKVTAHTIKS